MQKTYYDINESAAKQAKAVNSFSDYQEGSATQEYKRKVDYAFRLADEQQDTERAYYHADRYAKRLAKWTNDYHSNESSCPSVLICGAGNFPTRKKEKQNSRRSTLQEEYQKVEYILEQIEKVDSRRVEKTSVTQDKDFTNPYFDVYQNVDENRLQLLFDGKPSAEVVKLLKGGGWRWSGRHCAWQRQMTPNAFMSMRLLISNISRVEGE